MDSHTGIDSSNDAITRDDPVAEAVKPSAWTPDFHQRDDPRHGLDDLASSSSKRGQISATPGNSESLLLRLPAELLQHVLSYLSALELAAASATCRTLTQHALNDLLWANLVNSYLPVKINNSGPFDSFRRLYIAHHPCWFIPQQKIWFSNAEHTGGLILARYDNRRGVIEGYRVVAERRVRHLDFWEWNPEVIIQPFNPKVSLWLDDPVLLLKSSPFNSPGGPRHLSGEFRMPMALESQNVFNSFSLCHKEIPQDFTRNLHKQWPPRTIPSDRRVFCAEYEEPLAPWDERPRQMNQVSESAFRIRRWAHFGMGTPILTVGSSETLSTYGTLDPNLYTPTKEKPYQGIWVGDYSAHGCEFLLLLQRDYRTRSASPATTSTTSQSSDSDQSESDSQGIVHSGSLEAIKLTGDPNIPRGEISWIAEDIGRDGLIRIADEAPYQGARVVHSTGHTANLGFRNG